MKLINLMNLATRRSKALQTTADEFWRTSENTFLTGSDYYARRTEVMKKVLSELPLQESAIDVGCGNGTFTFLLGACARRITGYDISPELIRQASSRAEHDSTVFDFSVADIESPPSRGPFGLVTCIGVLSCIVDDRKFERVTSMLVSLVQPGGYLLLVDTLGINKKVSRAYRNGYIAKYRQSSKYENLWIDHGLHLKLKSPISDINSSLVNNLYLFQARKEITS